MGKHRKPQVHSLPALCQETDPPSSLHHGDAPVLRLGGQCAALVEGDRDPGGPQHFPPAPTLLGLVRSPSPGPLPALPVTWGRNVSELLQEPRGLPALSAPPPRLPPLSTVPAANPLQQTLWLHRLLPARPLPNAGPRTSSDLARGPSPCITHAPPPPRSLLTLGGQGSPAGPSRPWGRT